MIGSRLNPEGHAAYSGLIRVLLAASVLCALLLPLLLVEVPPLFDYPNHLARMVILAGQAPALAPYYAVKWAILPNIAMDLIVPGLLGWLPLHVAGRAIVALSVVLPLLGVIAYHRAVFRVWSAWPLAAALLAYNGLLLLGLLNFLVGIGAAFLVSALWIRWSASRLPLAAIALGMGLVLVFFCHLVAAGFLLMLAGSHELGRLWERRAEGGRSLREFVPRAAILAALLMLLGLLYLQVPSGGAAGGTAWLPLMERPLRLLVPFASYDARFDLLCAALVGLALGWMIATRRCLLHPGSVIVAVLCLLAFGLAPTEAGGGAFFEIRFAYLAALMPFAGLQPRPDIRGLRPLALGAAALGVARIGLVIWVWAGFAQDLRELRSAMAPVPAGARVATVTVERTANSAYFLDAMKRRIVSFLWLRADHHLGALLVTERRALWPGLFAITGQQPLLAGAPFADFQTSRWFALPDRRLLDPAWTPPAEVPPEALAAWRNWPERFDHILVLNARAAGDARSFLPDRLELVVDAGMAALYRVRPPSAARTQ